MNQLQVLTLTAPNQTTMPKLIQALHTIFAKNKTKVGYNNLALSFPYYSEESVGSTVDVITTKESLQYLSTNYTLRGMCEVNNVKVTENTIDLDSCEYASFVYDRRLGRGSPKNVEKALKAGIAREDIIMSQLERFMSCHLPSIQMRSSSGHNFPLRINKLVSSGVFDVNSLKVSNYGLCSYANPVVVPVREV